jgi:benzoyl-CoA reductase/2-hydroxyglutaryl-CoA dehydratase subunit BcrC/BadD/HgdB
MNRALEQDMRELLDVPVNQLVEEARGSGVKAIGYTCSYVPEPLIGVEGLVPIRLRAPGVAGTPLADTYLSSVLCPYTRSLLEFALDGMLDTLDGWVHTGSCDHLRRLYDNLEYLVKPDFNHIIDLPHKMGAAALQWFVDELKQLALGLEKHFGVAVDDEPLCDAIRTHNQCVDVLTSIDELRKSNEPRITGSEFHTLMIASSIAPKKAIIERIAKIKATLVERTGLPKHRARLMLVGSQLDDPGYIGIMESMGGLVVADRLCFGTIPALDRIEVNSDPITALARHYLTKVSCPRMMENFRDRVESIVTTAQECGVDAIVVQTMKFCDCWGVEASPLVTALRDAGFPVLRLEREYALTGEGQLKTRIQAFLESMGR